MKVAISQSSPVWLNKAATLLKVIQEIEKAKREKADLVIFGEGFVSGYPFWLSFTGGAKFDDELQKEMFSIYHQNAVNVENRELASVQQVCQSNNIATYLGVIEKTNDRGFTLYCSLVYIDQKGEIQSVHRKLVPTYEERLVWGNGDGNGLKTHSLKGFTLGGLNCWENWMPLSRTALYAQGENVHIAVWPGSDYNTNEITRFIARESRSYVISVSSILTLEDVSKSLPIYGLLKEKAPQTLANGGSCIAKPNGEWLIEPVIDKSTLVVAELDFNEITRERQNFDPTGHYSRPDVLSLNIDTERQKTLIST